MLANFYILSKQIFAESGNDDQKTSSDSSNSTDSNQISTNSSDSNNATSSTTNSACLPYPDDLQSLQECCKTPILFEDDLVGTCEFMCSEDKKHGQEPDCPILCLFNNNGIMRRTKINRTALEVFYNKNGLGNPAWKNITSDGLDRCKLDYEEGKFHETVKDFEKCMTSNYQQHCIEFKAPLECDKVEDFMYKCQNFQDDCSIWPKWIIKLPEFCCDHPPELFPAKVKDEAAKLPKCDHEVSNAGKMQCAATYMLHATGMRIEAKWDFDIALKNLKESVNDDPKWNKAIEKTVEICKADVESLNFSFMRGKLFINNFSR